MPGGPMADDPHNQDEDPRSGDSHEQGPSSDPGRIATQQDFGRELTLARRRAGLTVREVARAAGIPASTAGDYFSGRHLPPPSQPDSLPRILAACGVTDLGLLREWASALVRVRRAPGRRAVGASAPYRGLASFEPEDAEWFFGREELTAHLLIRATAGTTAAGTTAAGTTAAGTTAAGTTAAGTTAAGPTGTDGTGDTVGVPLVVIGSSGSGKSSLLRAGLIPRLLAADPTRPLALFTPGASPLADLARQLSRLGLAAGTDAGETEAALRSDPEGSARLVGQVSYASRAGPAIIVDQFEEAFTDCLDEDERRAFITALCALSGPAVVVLALRADFYDRALSHPGLSRALQQRQVVVGPMTWEQVRRAIVEPARKARLDVDDGLVELLLRDLAPAAGGGNPPGAGPEPGVLPLLSHALLATWQNGHGGSLTVTDYQASGGIHDAIARTAEAVYEELADEQRGIARRLFLRLVHVVNGAAETRSTVALSELREWPRGAASADDVLDRFVDGRLITLDADTARISHEALITAWPRLRAWIDSDREGLRTRQRITATAHAWDEAGRDSAVLLRGAQLAIARDWAADPVNRFSLTPLAREFVDTGTAQEKLHNEAERRRTRRLRRLVATLTVLVLATVALAGYAFQQREVATTARNDAQSREVAIEASQIRDQSVSLAGQLSLAAYRIAPTAQARAALLEASGTPAAARLADSADVVQSVSLSPDHRVLAVAAADGTLRLWDVARPARPVPLGRSLTAVDRSPLYTTAFAPNGRLLAAAGTAETVQLWDVSDPGHPVRLKVPLSGPTSTVYSLAFSPDGRTLAAGSADDTVRLWNLADLGQARPIATLTGPAGYVKSIAFSPDGTTLAAGSADRKVRLWDVADPRHPMPLGAPLTGAADGLNTVAFSPDGASLAAGSSDDHVLVWHLASHALAASLPHPQPVTSLAWDGTGQLITGDADGTVRNWALPTPVLLARGSVNSVAFSPDGGTLAVGSRDLELWNPARRTMTAAAARPGTFVNAVAFSPGGKVLAAGYSDGSIQLWLVAGDGTAAALGQPVRASAIGHVDYVAFSRDGRLLACGSDDGTLRVWSVSDPARPRQLAVVQNSPGSTVYSVAFSPDGRVLAAASADNLTRLWDIANPARPARLGSPLAGPGSYAISVAFSPDGQILPTGATDGTVWLWNMADRTRPDLVAELTGPAGHVYSVAFGHADRTLAAGSADGTVRIWDTMPGAAAAAVCADAGQPISAAEWASYIPGRPYNPPCR